MSILSSEADVARGVEALRGMCPHMAMIAETCGVPALRWREPGFGGLVSTITAQQVSTSAANAIRGKLRAVVDPITPEGLMAMSDEALRACGYSAGKVKTLRAIASAILAGDLPIERLGDMPVEEAHASLVKVHGIGPWTAEVWLMFCVGTQDVFAPGDLALQEGAKLAMGLETRPTAKEIAIIAERWRPWRAVAARMLWAYYGHVKKRAGVVTN
ncbi:MAG: Fe-S cluster assembly protein HesB [Methylobacterium sp.]|nr:MAG: Fe-S cluster assembly protein HesB [Methylobacterium sp.]